MKSSILYCLIISFLCHFQDSWAKKYYKHVDENGIIHYADQPPAETIDYESYQVRPEDSQYEVSVVNRGTKKAPLYYAINPYHGPIEVVIQLPGAENIQTEPPWPASYVVPANSELFLTAITPVDKYKAWSYRYSMSSVMGDPHAIHQTEHVYLRPFPEQQTHYISQTFGGEFSHTGEQSYHAIDIVMPEGTPVLAARAGVVMDVADDFYDGGLDRNKLQRGNYIRILHDDGSMAVYAHLQLESVIVATGQQVVAGQKIAQSGSTGYASGPHLHFAVQVNTGLRLTSVPFVLKHKNGTVKAPVRGPI